MSRCRLHGFVCVALLRVFLSGNLAAQPGSPLSVQNAEDSARIEETVQVMQGLRDRQLFDLAQRFAADQLASEEVQRIDRCTIVIEQIRNATAQAIHSTGDARRKAWATAEQLAAGFRREDPTHPRIMLVDAQLALMHLAQGSLIQQEIAAEISEAAQKNSALEQFRLATAKFRDVEKQIERLLPIQRSRTLNPGDLSSEELMNLKISVRYQLARVNLARAELLDAEDPLNRIDALNQVLARLDEVLAQSNPQLPLWWRAQLSRARCYRLMGRPNRAAEVFAGLPEMELTSDLVTERLTEQLLLAAESSTDEKDALLALAEPFDRPPAQLQLAALRLILALATSEGASKNNQWARRAAKLVDDIEANHGDYWGRRAEIMLVGSVPVPTETATVNNSDYAILVRQGDAAFRKQNYDDAVRAYGKAVAFAEATDDVKSTIALTVRLSRCLELTQQHFLAAERLLTVAQRYPDSEDAAAIYLRGCWNEAQEIGGDASRQAEYLQHLQRLVDTWPESTSADQARLWQGHHHLSKQDWPAALDCYLGISNPSPFLLQSMPFVQSAANQLWRTSETTSGNNRAAINALVSRLVDKLALGTNPKSKWTESEQQLLLLLLRFALVSGTIEPDDLSTWLDSAIRNSGDTESSWRQQARGWKVILQGVQSESAAVLQQQLEDLPNRFDLMQNCFRELNQHLSESQRKEYAAVMEMICSKALIDDRLTEQQREVWETRQALAQAQAGNLQTARRNLQELASRYPDSLEIQLELARVLSQLQPNGNEAMEQWRRLSGRLKPGTEPWFEAKYNIARLLTDTDRGQEAKRLLEYLQATQLQWKSSGWAASIESLLQELRQAGS